MTSTQWMLVLWIVTFPVICLIKAFGPIEESVSWTVYRAFKENLGLPLLIGVGFLLFAWHVWIEMAPPPARGH